MLRYKRITIDTVHAGTETILEILSCPKGRRYKIVSITSAPAASIYLRVYKNAEQIVDAASIVMTEGKPFLDMDASLDVGDVVKAGFYNDGVVEDAKEITIGYKDE